MHRGSQVATRDLEPPCQVAIHQRTNLVPRRVRHGLQCSWGEPGSRSVDGREGWWRDSMGWRWWHDELSRRRWDLRRRRRTRPLRLAAHLASWGRCLGFGDWEFGGDFRVDLSLIWRERDRFESREDRFGGRGGRFGGREGRFGAQWKEECREEHEIGGGDFFARDGLGAGFFASGAMIQPSE